MMSHLSRVPGAGINVLCCALILLLLATVSTRFLVMTPKPLNHCKSHSCGGSWCRLRERRQCAWESHYVLLSVYTLDKQLSLKWMDRHIWILHPLFNTSVAASTRCLLTSACHVLLPLHTITHTLLRPCLTMLNLQLTLDWAQSESKHCTVIL